MLKVINLFAGPGAGKSTTAAGLFFEMKARGYSVELVTEYAKDKVYEGHLGCLEDQIYIFGKQQRRICRLVDHVEWAITDSPIPISILYNKDLSESFNTLVMETFSWYDNYNFYIERCKPYVKTGRTQEEHEARELDQKMLSILDKYTLPYQTVLGNIYAPSQIREFIEKKRD